MSKEGENNLFEEDFSIFADNISEMIGEDSEQNSQKDSQMDQYEQNTEIVEGGGGDSEDDTQYNQEGFDQEQQDEEGAESNEDSNQEDGEGAQSSKENNDDIDDSSPSLTPFAKLLVDEGILPNLNLEEYDGTVDGLIEATRNQVYNGIEEYKQSLPEEAQKILQGVEAGIPFEQLIELDKQQLQYKNIDEETLSSDENLQKQVVKDYYKQTSRFSDEHIDKMIERLSDLGELEEESKISVQELTKLQEEQQQQAIQQAEQERQRIIEEQQKQLDDFRKTLEQTEEVIPGVKVSKAIKEKIERNITTPVAYDQNGNPVNKIGKYRNENPIDFEIKLNYLFEATKGFTDFGVFSKKGKSDALKELEDVSKSLDNRNTSRSNKAPKANKDIAESINYFMQNFGE